MGDIYSEEGDPDSFKLFPEVPIISDFLLMSFMVSDHWSQ